MDKNIIPEKLEKCKNEIICHKCGLVLLVDEASQERIKLANGGYHIRLSCSACGTFLKFLQHSPKQVLHFGKYQNMDISWIAENDMPYLRSLLKWKKLKNSTRDAIEKMLGGDSRW